MEFKESKTIALPSILSAWYGSVDGRIKVDVTAPLKRSGTLAFFCNVAEFADEAKRRMIISPPHILFGDPCPGVPKKLVVAMDTDREYHIFEFNAKWSSEAILPCFESRARFRIECVPTGGITNQLFTFLRAAWLANSLGRTISLPLLTMRTTFEDSMERGNMFIDGKLKKFTSVFDEIHFSRCVHAMQPEYFNMQQHGCPIFENEPDYSGSTCKVEWRSICAKEIHPRSRAALEKDICVDDTPCERVVCQGFTGYRIEDEGEFEFYMRIILALRPAAPLLSIANEIWNNIKKVGGDACRGVCVVHARLETDWSRVFEAADWSIPLAAALENTPCEGYTIYFSGHMPVDAIAFFRVAAEHHPLQPVICHKGDFKDIPSFGFDEGGVIDREIGLRADVFVGYAPSTLSCLICLQREHEKKDYATYPRGKAEFARRQFMFENDVPQQITMRKVGVQSLPGHATYRIVHKKA